jgi:hypothetical protein
VLSLLSCIPLGVIFGIVALRQIKRTGQRSRGIAIAGLVISGVWMIPVVTILIIGLITGLGTSASRNSSGQISHAGQLGFFSLRTGDCFTRPLGEAAGFVQAIPCAQPHYEEVFATFQLSGAGYPGEPALWQSALTGCESREANYVNLKTVPSTIQAAWLFPDQAAWSRGERQVICVFKEVVKARTGSLRTAR